MADQFKQAGILKESPAPPASNGGAKEARPVRAEPQPGRTDPLPTSLDSLEQQMARLLRGSDKKR
ncbi:MAG TPA: hypothetical protein VFP43_05825 [Mesorhizobium sp.]|nr:hypothetical protein [Mesorhizobium sp.]